MCDLGIWRLFRGTCRCCHAAGRILCPCDRADLENKFRNDENYFRYIDGSDRGCVVILFSGQLNGVREGTIIAALLVGFIARVLGKKLEFIKPVLFPEEYETKREVSEKIQNGGKQYRKNIIVIGRQYGSGGHDIGMALAEKLGFSFL